MEGAAKQQEQKTVSHARQAPSAPGQDRQLAFPVGVLPSLPRVSPRRMLPCSGCAILICLGSLRIYRVTSREAIFMDKWWWVRKSALSGGDTCVQLSVRGQASSKHLDQQKLPQLTELGHRALLLCPLSGLLLSLSPSMPWMQPAGPVF